MILACCYYSSLLIFCELPIGLHSSGGLYLLILALWLADIIDFPSHFFFLPGCDPFVFLLYAQGSNFGISVRAADVVIMFDTDVHPQYNSLCQLDGHHVGRDNPTKIYRLLTTNSLEQILFNRLAWHLFQFFPL